MSWTMAHIVPVGRCLWRVEHTDERVGGGKSKRRIVYERENVRGKRFIIVVVAVAVVS